MAGRPYPSDFKARNGTSLDMNMHHQYGSSYQDQVPKLQAEVGMLKWNNTLLLTQLARAVKCLNAVSAENELLRTEVASLLPSRACQDAQ